MPKGQALKKMVMERLVVAADEIFALFERTIAEYEQEALRTQLSEETRNKGVQALSVNLEVVPSPERIKEDQTPCIKKEEDPPLDLLTCVSVKTEDHVEKSFLLQQEPPEENREEPGCSLSLQSDKDKQTYSCSDTDNSDDWEPSAKRSTTCDGQESKTVKDSKRGRAAPTHSQEQMNVHCTMTFRNKSRVNRHANSQKDKKPFSCSICEKCFSRESYLKGHLVSHTEEKPFSCPECGLQVKHRQNVYRHISIVHRRERPYSCPVCKITFRYKSRLNLHLNTHKKEKPFSCSVCEKCFGQKYYLKRHMESHTGEKPFSCSVCKKSFGQNRNLKEHMNTHSGKKTFSCPECDLKFMRRHNMERHISGVHRGEKPYSCPECAKAFAQKSDFIKHKRTHTGEKPFSCQECERAFTLKNDLIQHMRTHTGEKPFSCTVCNMRFSVKCSLKRHIQTHTTVQNECVR